MIQVPTAEPNAPTSEPATAAEAVIIGELLGVQNVSALAFSLANGWRSSDCIATRSTDDGVLAQDVVGDVLQLCHNSNSRMRAPFN